MVTEGLTPLLSVDAISEREQILLNTRESLLAIRRQADYLNDVGTVELEFKTYAEVVDEGLPLPYICFFPAKGKPPPEYLPFGVRREFLDIIVIAHVDAEDAMRGIRNLSSIEVDIHNTMVGNMTTGQGDPTRGGAAVDTVKSSGEETDEGVPDKVLDARNGTSTMVETFRVTYYPEDC